MKQGKTLEGLGRELERQRRARKDFVADTRSLGLITDDRGSLLTMATGQDRQEFCVNDLAHQQISARLGIPYRYYQKMQTEQPRLLDENVNTWFQQTPEPWCASWVETCGHSSLTAIAASTIWSCARRYCPSSTR